MEDLHLVSIQVRGLQLREAHWKLSHSFGNIN